MLKVLKLRKQKELRLKERGELAEKLAGLETQLNEVRTAMEQAKTDEDIALVEEQADGLETEANAANEKIKSIDDEIAGIDKELDELADKNPAAPAETHSIINRTEEIMISKRHDRNPFGQTRDARAAYLAAPEVKEFYERVLDLAHEKRGGRNAGDSRCRRGDKRHAWAGWRIVSRAGRSDGIVQRCQFKNKRSFKKGQRA